MRNLFFSTLLILPAGLSAQNSLHLSPGASFYIDAGTSVTIDSLVLTPSAGYTITGSNTMQRAASTIHAGSNPHINRVFQWMNTLPPFTGNISFYYQDGELNGISENDLTLTVHNGTGWNAYINNVIRNSTNNLVTTTLSGVALNELTLASSTGPLPMVWLDIAAQRRNSSVQISWQTADETNCAGYQVEKSNNGVNWSNLGNAMKAYNLTGPNNYSLSDPNIPAAISYYRVRQNDLDGRYTYSRTVSVKSDQSNNVWLYPVPANDVLTIVVGGNQQLKALTVYNTAGSLVASLQPTQAASHTLNIQHLPAGNYTAIIVLRDNSTIARNFIKR